MVGNAVGGILCSSEWMMVLVEGPLLRKALQKFSEEILIVIGSIILGANFILLVSNEVGVVYCAAVLFALGNGLMWPSVLSLLSKRAGSTHQGAVQGIAGSFGSLASIIGLTVGGILYHFAFLEEPSSPSQRCCTIHCFYPVFSTAKD